MSNTLPLSIFSRIKVYIENHKIVSTIVVLIIALGGYYGYKKMTDTSAETRYVLGLVQKTTVVASVSASGQVSSYDKIDVKPKVGGDITWVGVKAGDTVYSGQAIAQIDDTTANQAIADAEQSLLQAKLQLQKDTAQAPIDYQKMQEALDESKSNLKTAYNDTYNSLSNAYIDLPSVVTGMQNTLYGYDLSPSKSDWNVTVFKNNASYSNTSISTFADIAEKNYKTARTQYDQSVIDYKTLTRYSNNEDLEKFLTESINSTTAIAQSLQSELNLLDAVVDDAQTHNFSVNPSINSMRTNVRSYLSTTNGDLSSLLNQQNSLDSAKKAIRDNQRNIDIYMIGNASGNKPISLQSSEYSITDQERRLQQLKDGLSNYVIVAPFSGSVAVLNVNRGDTVSSGTAVTTLITAQKIAGLSLNEVDVAKINVGDKVTLTFDAVEGLTLTGKVVEIDSVGTVSQGVVSYTVNIGFDSQDTRIKPGMTANASIQTDIKQDVLAVPSSAVKTQGGTSFVQVFNPPLQNTGGSQGVISAVAPQQVQVELGISDDSSVEILSGLKEGDQIVTRTILGTTTTTSPTTSNSSNTRTGGVGVPRTGIRLN